MSVATDIGAAGIGATIGGGVSSAIGSFMGGAAQQQYYNYQAGVAQFNAQIMQQNSEYAINVGEIQAQQSGLSSGQQMGKIVAGQAASGLDVNSGSNKAVQASQLGIERTSATAIRSTAAKTAYNYQVEGNAFSAQAGADIAAGKNSMEAGIIGGISSIVGSASSVSSEWLKGQSQGLWGAPSSGGSSGGSGGIGAN
jgi:hypothetical protein